MLPYSAWNFSQLWPSCGTARARRECTYRNREKSQERHATDLGEQPHPTTARSLMPMGMNAHTPAHSPAQRVIKPKLPRKQYILTFVGFKTLTLCFPHLHVVQLGEEAPRKLIHQRHQRLRHLGAVRCS